jgi:hypothetical protein
MPKTAHTPCGADRFRTEDTTDAIIAPAITVWVAVLAVVEVKDLAKGMGN